MVRFYEVICFLALHIVFVFADCGGSVSIELQATGCHSHHYSYVQINGISERLGKNGGIFAFVIKPDCSVRKFGPQKLDKFKKNFSAIAHDSFILLVSQRNCYQDNNFLPPAIGNQLNGIDFDSYPFYAVFRRNISCCDELLKMETRTSTLTIDRILTFTLTGTGAIKTTTATTTTTITKTTTTSTTETVHNATKHTGFTNMTNPPQSKSNGNSNDSIIVITVPVLITLIIITVVILMYCFKGNVLALFKYLKKSDIENPLERVNHGNDKGPGETSDGESIYACIVESSKTDRAVNNYLTAVDAQNAMSPVVNSVKAKPLFISGITNAAYMPSHTDQNINNKNVELYSESRDDEEPEQLETNYSYIDDDDDENELRKPIEEDYEDNIYRVVEPEESCLKINGNYTITVEDEGDDYYELESTYTPIDSSNILNDDYGVLQF